MTFPNSVDHVKDTETMRDYFQALKLLDRCPEIICEFGIYVGGSLLMLNDFLAPKKIIGFDISPIDFAVKYPDKKYPIECRWFDQMNSESVKKAASEYQYITDLFIDDCSHIKKGIIDTVYAFWPKLRLGGLYVIEDLHCASNETQDFKVHINDYFTDLSREITSYKTIVALRKI